MTIRLVPTADGGLWDRIVAAHAGGTAFHEWEWLQLTARHFGWRFHPLLAEQDGEAVGVVPVILRPGLPAHSVRPPFPYTGPVVDPDLLPATLAALRRWQLRHGLPRVRFEFAPGVDAGAALDATSCSWERDATFLVALAGRSPDELRAAMGQHGRRAVRKAAASGVEVRPSRPGEVADLLPRLFEEAWSSRGEPAPYPASIFAELDERSRENGRMFATTAVLRGEPVGVQLALLTDDTVYCWGGGALRAHRAQQPFTAIAFHLLCWASEHGYRSVDLVGKVDEGVAGFKRQLGGTEVPYLVAASTRVPKVAARAVRSLVRTPSPDRQG